MERDVEAELRGRLVALETLLAVMLARLAGLSDNPAQTIVGVMANAEDMIERACESAAGEDHAAADYARAAFDEISKAMQQHVLRIAETRSGRA